MLSYIAPFQCGPSYVPASIEFIETPVRWQRGLCKVQTQTLFHYPNYPLRTTDYEAQKEWLFLSLDLPKED
ncbi:hypothetical protein BELL_0330g00130 [Botrytis elliptica]|uniref:Uncharacterized protein n=1 Tax=Botrytis elliptica TaxID=278938 RepID=A0A4Z1JY07_9HELO|nr:hypothetical protein BELL_0330g00130 [Botrytis elliptica]